MDFLDGFCGYLQVDDYAANEQTQANPGGMLGHARRKFIEAKRAHPKGKSGKAEIALSYIQKLYAIESLLKVNRPKINE
ncbi:MAG: transposase [Shewanella sp.]|nr:transposase [Shewanella sp.]